MSLFNKIMFFPSLAYNLALEKLTSRNWYDRIDENLILGALPFRSVLARLSAEENVKGVISFNEDFEVNSKWYPNADEFQALNIKFLRLPVQDFVATPSQAQLEEGIKFIEEIISQNGTVYAHCKAGRFRSAYFVVAYLIKIRKMNVTEAVTIVSSKRKQTWLGPKQIAELQKFRDIMFSGNSNQT